LPFWCHGDICASPGRGGMELELKLELELELELLELLEWELALEL
jgi:hypothetical protein